nr:MAG TPA: hypothetical protein [Caudoviricetes sp.]
MIKWGVVLPFDYLLSFCVFIVSYFFGFVKHFFNFFQIR